MSTVSIESRVTALEAEVWELRKLVKKDSDLPWWEKTCPSKTEGSSSRHP